MLLVQRVEQRQESLLIGDLDRPRQILVFLLEGIVRHSSWPQQLGQGSPVKQPHGRSAILPSVGNVIAVVSKIFQVQPESSVGPELEHVAQRVDVGRIAIRREPHHLVLVAVMRKAEELRQRAVKNT